MPRRRRTRVNWGFAVVVAVLLAAVTLITLSDSFDFTYIPTWDELFEQTELSQPSFTESEFSVHIIDVGQGDSILVQSPNHNLLIDASEREYGTQVVNYLQAQGVESLDYVIATHPHADHIGGMAEVINQMDVQAVMAPQVPKSIVPTTQVYRNLLLAVKNKGLTIERPDLGGVYEFDDGMRFTVIGPVEPSTEMNDNSIVIRLEYGETSFLLTGDSEADMEAEILSSGAALSADVLKAGHHGSHTSTDKEYLAAINPSYAAISCGVDNRYGHPHRETLSKFNAAGVQVYRTDLDGTIIFESDGAALNVVTVGKQDAAA